MRLPHSLHFIVILTGTALNGCGGGAGGDNAPMPTAAPPVVEPVRALLTNAQLNTPADANEAITDADATRWFAENSKIVRSLNESEDFSDLAFLEPVLRDKSLVQLGESGHGVEEFSAAKLRLIRYLHEEQGYDVLSFESGMFDCERSQETIASATASDSMRTCVFPVWHTTTVRALFDYVRSTQSSARPLRITGFDVQQSGSRFLERAANTAALFEKVSPQRALEVSEIETSYLRLIREVSVAVGPNTPPAVQLRNELPTIRNDYAVMADELLASIDQITADGEFTERDVLIAEQYLRTTPFNADQFDQILEPGRGQCARDEGMALNLIALHERIYPGEKIIAWAHNVHIRNRSTGFDPACNMGRQVHEALDAQLYTLGFYMYRGQHAFNDREIRTVAPPINRSLEAIFHSRRLRWLFLDLENAPATGGHEWINQTIPTFDWGEFLVPLELAREYDGLFLIDTVTPPSYLN
jgi:erythromycin esterase